MKHLILCLFILNCFSVNAQHSTTVANAAGSVIIRAAVPPHYKKQTLNIKGLPASPVFSEMNEEFDLVDSVKEHFASWRIPIKKPFYAYGSFVYMNASNRIGFLLEKGDNINIEYTPDGNPVFSGKSAKKFELIAQLSVLQDSLDRAAAREQLSKAYGPLTSLQDYFNWNNHLNTELKIKEALIDQYKKYISVFAYNKIKTLSISITENIRMTRFSGLAENPTSDAQTRGELKVNPHGLTNKDICAIYDSTLNGPAVKWMLLECPVASDPIYSYMRLSYEAHRIKGKFFKENPSDTSVVAKEKVDQYVYRYYLAKKLRKGEMREATLAYFFRFSKGALRKTGFEPKMEAILSDYYANSKYPEYVRAVKEYELELREKKNGARDMPFSLTDKDGNEVKNERLEGKVTLFDFWFTGCKGCVELNPILSMIEKRFENNPDVQFVNVSVDKDKEQWLNSVTQKKYTTGNGISLYTAGKGMNHSLIKNYMIGGYPSLLLFDAGGRSMPEHLMVNPRTDSGKALIALIEKQLVLMKDGPYVFHKNNGANINYINGKKLKTDTVQSIAGNTVQVQTDTYATFPVELKNKLEIGPSVFPAAERLLVLSDIEGNFDALRKLLQAGRVIDENYNWTFGNGHLVFAGDMFDRGQQVTECLWLIYSLEEKAKKAGGYVHFVLGNHEIMNLYGNYKYTRSKYKDNAAQMNYNLDELYGEQSELGRWLRTKNIIEKIGDILFVHAGIYKTVNDLNISLEGINTTARPFYATRSDDYRDPVVKTIMNDKSGIFWYRGYYSGNDKERKTKIMMRIDSTLEKFSVKHIITGHTIVEDTISAHYDGKLINVDTKHSEGKSEALLIEGDKYYRINNKGNKALLFIEEKKKQQNP